MAGHEPGDYEVLVNGGRSGCAYADLNIEIEVADLLQNSNRRDVITVNHISTGTTLWRPPAP